MLMIAGQPVLDEFALEKLDALRRKVATRKPFYMDKLEKQMSTKRGIDRYEKTIAKYHAVRIEALGAKFDVAYALEFNHPNGSNVKHISIWNLDKKSDVPYDVGDAVALRLGFTEGLNAALVFVMESKDGYHVYNLMQNVFMAAEGGTA